MLAYLVNQYPTISHSFIRREIVALEAMGLPVQRFSIRRIKDPLVDPADQAELSQTRVVLDGGLKSLLLHSLQVVLTRPIAFFSALQLAWQIGWGSDRGFLRHLAYLAEACIFLHWFQEAGIRHVHAHFGTNSTTVALFCHQLGGPSYSFTVHGPEEFDKPKGIALTRKIEQATFVVAISSFGRSQLYRWCDYSHWPKIHVVHCGVDDSFLAAEPVPIPDRPDLVCVGRLSEQKGHLLLLEAVQLLQQRMNQPFHLVLVGDGPLRSEIEARIQQYQLQQQVTIAGWASNDTVIRKIQAARALVLPSFAEGLPVVLMEALALGRPVVTTYVAGIPELVEAGRSGWLVPAGAVEELAAALQAVLSCSVEHLQAMGYQGRQRVQQQHNIRLETAKLNQLFRQSLRDHP